MFLRAGDSVHFDDLREIQSRGRLSTLPQDWQHAPCSTQPHGPQRYCMPTLHVATNLSKIHMKRFKSRETWNNYAFCKKNIKLSHLLLNLLFHGRAAEAKEHFGASHSQLCGERG